MKMIKKIVPMLLAVCLLVPFLSLTTFAAEGNLVFTDPTTKVGETVTVEVKMRAAAAIGDGKVTLTYDATALEFKEGTNTTSTTAGTLQLSATGNGTEQELAYTLQFKSLKEGETTITAGVYEAYLYSDEKLNLSLGSAKVTAGPGSLEEEGTSGGGTTTDVKVTVDNKPYFISEDFKEVDIPPNFTETELTYEGEPRKVITQDKSGQFMIYLQAEDGTSSDFFLYNKDNGEFSPFVMIDLDTSQDKYIILLRDKEDVKLPSEYTETTIKVDNREFPAWQSSKEPEFYIVHALHSNGANNLYRYDVSEGTYQRFEAPVEEAVKKPTTIIEKVLDFVEKNLAILFIAVWAVFLLMLIIIIVLGVKLHHRNQDLDFMEEEKEAALPEKVKKSKRQSKEDNLDELEGTSEVSTPSLQSAEEFESLEDNDELGALDSTQNLGLADLNVEDMEDSNTGLENVDDGFVGFENDRLEADFEDEYEEDLMNESTVQEKAAFKEEYKRFTEDKDFAVDFIDLDD